MSRSNAGPCGCAVPPFTYGCLYARLRSYSWDDICVCTITSTCHALTQALVAVPSYLFVETFQALLPLALGFAAGAGEE
jgi:hypothetical protein